MPKTLHIYPVNPSADDIDAAVRTVWGEARGEGVIGEQAVAGVIRNRAMVSGQSIGDVVRTGRFSGYGPRALALPSDSADYRAIRANIEGILRGTMTNPAGTSTYYRNPETATASMPTFAPNYPPGQRLGRHVFYSWPFPHEDSPVLSPQPGAFGRPARPFPALTNVKPPDAVMTPQMPGQRATLAQPSSSDLALQGPGQRWTGTGGADGQVLGASSDGAFAPGVAATAPNLAVAPAPLASGVDPGAGAAMAAVGGKPPSPYDRPPSPGPAYAQIASHGTVRPEDVANLGYQNAHILARLLGPQPSSPPAQTAQDPAQAMLLAALMAQGGYPSDPTV